MTEHAAPSRAGRWAKRIGLVLFSLLLTLAMLEGLARLLHLGSGGFWEPNERYGWQNIAGARGWESCYGECEVYVEINDQGLRDYDYPYARPAGVTRVLFLGDSMTAGMQVPLEDTFVKRLEQGLTAGGGSWEVINAAVNAFGTDNELIFFREEASKYEPDVVVLSMYLANDIYNNHYELETRLGGSGHKPYFTLSVTGELVLNNFPVEGAETLSTRFFGFLNRNFQLPRFIAQTMNLRRSVPDALKPLIALATGNRGAEEVAEADQTAGPTPAAAGSPATPRVNICQDTYAPVIAEAWDLTRAILLQLREEVEATGATLVVLVIPAAPQLVVPEEGKDWYCDQPNRELTTFLEAEGIAYLDMLQPFRDHALAGGAPLYYQTDFHMNGAGHELAGQLLTEFFEEQAGGW